MEEATTEQPFWYQDAGIDRLVDRRGKSILFFPPGAGKTRVVEDYLTLLARAKDDEVRVMVVCPPSALYTWVRQSRRYLVDVPLDVEVMEGSVVSRWSALNEDRRSGPAPGPRVKMRVFPLSSFCSTTVRARDRSPEQLVAAKTATRRQRAFIVRAADRWDGDVLIVDESHRFSNPTGVGGRLLRTIAPSFPRRIELTGTLMPRGYENLWGQLTILDKDVFVPLCGRSSWTAFKDRYISIDPYSHMVTGYKHTDELEALVSEHVLSITPEEAATGRPPVTFARVPFRLSSRERAQYDKMRRELALEIGDATSVPPSAMTMTLRLRQLASGFLGMDDGSVTETGTSRRDAAYDLVSGTLEAERRVLVFGEFLHDVHAVAARLRRDKGTTVLQVTGETSVAERERMLAQFFDLSGDDRIVIVAQVATLGESVNELVAACHGVMLEPMWNRAAWIQALGRLDRTGQEWPVTWWLLEAEDTIDGRIYRATDEKGSLEDIIREECRAVR